MRVDFCCSAGRLFCCLSCKREELVSRVGSHSMAFLLICSFFHTLDLIFLLKFFHGARECYFLICPGNTSPFLFFSGFYRDLDSAALFHLFHSRSLVGLRDATLLLFLRCFRHTFSSNSALHFFHSPSMNGLVVGLRNTALFLFLRGFGHLVYSVASVHLFHSAHERCLLGSLDDTTLFLFFCGICDGLDSSAPLNLVHNGLCSSCGHNAPSSFFFGESGGLSHVFTPLYFFGDRIYLAEVGVHQQSRSRLGFHHPPNLFFVCSITDAPNPASPFDKFGCCSDGILLFRFFDPSLSFLVCSFAYAPDSSSPFDLLGGLRHSISLAGLNNSTLLFFSCQG
mmetsp:Transcript_20329/g.40270  ORF Transcript_20329/g.40270 Transcript_20329/m.40270 type:complete len:339 (+) Transcript_20329:280-1296(+)